MSRILIKGYAGTEHVDATPCLCLDLDAATANQWVHRIKVVEGLRKADREVYSLDYWEHKGDFFDLYSLNEKVEGIGALIDALESEETVIVDDASPSVQAEVERALESSQYDEGARILTEVDRLEVTERYVVRSACIKHTGIRLESVTLHIKELEKFAGGFTVKEAD